MINKVLKLYACGSMTQNELFICMALLAQNEEWDRVVDLLSEDDQLAFKIWATELVGGDYELVLPEVGPLFSSQGLGILREHLIRREWLSRNS